MPAHPRQWKAGLCQLHLQVLIDKTSKEERENLQVELNMQAKMICAGESFIFSSYFFVVLSSISFVA